METGNRPRRVLIVGGVAGGASCAARLRRMDEHAEIIVFEKGPYASYANCGLPYHAGGIIADEDSLLVAKPAIFRDRLRVDVRVNSEVIFLRRGDKRVVVRDLQTGGIYEEAYDALVLSPGAVSLKPPIPGIELPGIFTVRTIPDARHIRQWIEGRDARRAVVVGGGYIGLEMVENLAHRGLHTTLIEMLPQVMPTMDAEMMTAVHEHLRSHGVDVHLGTQVAAFEAQADGGLRVRTKDRQEFTADLVILSIGIRPNGKLAADAGLEVNERGAIRVNEHMQTSDPAIYAVGDAVETREVPTGRPVVVPLAGPANRQGRIAADHIAGRREARFRGVQATAVVGLFGLTIATTGLSEKIAREIGLRFEKVYLFPGHHAGYYPGAQPIHLKLLFDPKDGRILGAQAVGREGVERRIDVLAMAMQMEATVFDLEEAELCYAPQYGSAKDPVNIAGFIAANHIRGDAPLAHWGAGDSSSAVVLDVREAGEFAAGSVPGALHIPLGGLRERLGELPREREIRVYCGVGGRSHVAVRLLREHGLDARNLSGGWRQYLLTHGGAKEAKAGR